METNDPSLSATHSIDTQESIWRFVPAGEYRPPESTVQATVRSSLADFIVGLRKRSEPEQPVFKAVDTLRALSSWMLRRTAPEIEWSAAAAASAAALNEWSHNETPDSPAIIVLGPPHSGTRPIVELWASQQGLPILEPPSPEQILQQDRSWLEMLPREDGPWVLPALEKCYLRNLRGLSLVRAFFDAVMSGAYGRCVIACDTWAWAFLSHIWYGRVSRRIQLQALSEAELATWFQQLASHGGSSRYAFRQSDNGAYVLPATDEHNGESGSAARSDYLSHLAIYSRGIAGVAWATWRQSLLADPDELPKEGEESNGQDGDSSGATTIWVSPWERVNRPSLPKLRRREQAFVLHALLLHGGLSADLLLQVLPLSGYDIVQTLLALQAAGFVSNEADVWQVTPLAYPEARRILRAEGYLVD